MQVRVLLVTKKKSGQQNWERRKNNSSIMNEFGIEVQRDEISWGELKRCDQNDWKKYIR